MLKFKRIANPLKKPYEYWRLWLFVITMLMFILLPKHWIFELYTKRIYFMFRSVIDPLSASTSVPFLYILIICLVTLILFKVYKIYRLDVSWKHRFFHAVKYLSKSLMTIVILFYWLWGFNYGSISFLDYNNVKAEPVAFEFVEEEYFRVLDTLNLMSGQIKGEQWNSIDQKELGGHLARFLDLYYVNGRLNPVVRSIKPKGFLLRLGAQGIYLPWTGEGQIDAGLHDLQKPFTYLHELGHGYGITNEGECNFLAYQIGINIDDVYVQYSAYLAYWRYLARQMLIVGCHDVDLMSNDLREDLQEIYDNYDKYPDFFPRLRRQSYDWYLKAQGVEEGMKSYSEIIMMNYCWENNRK